MCAENQWLLERLHLAGPPKTAGPAGWSWGGRASPLEAHSALPPARAPQIGPTWGSRTAVDADPTSNHHDSTPGGSSLWMSGVSPKVEVSLGNQVTDPPSGGLTLFFYHLLPPTSTYYHLLLPTSYYHLLPPTTYYHLLPPTTPKTDPVRPLLGTSQAAEVLVTRTPAAPLATDVNRMPGLLFSDVSITDQLF